MFHHQRNVAEHWLTLQYWWFYPSIYKHCHRCGVYPWLHIMFLLGFPMVWTTSMFVSQAAYPLRCLVATMVLSFGSTFVYFFYTYGEETRHLASESINFWGHKLTLDVGGIKKTTWLVVWNMNFIMFHNIWDNPSHWLKFFRVVRTTNQLPISLVQSTNVHGFYVFCYHVFSINSRLFHEFL